MVASSPRSTRRQRDKENAMTMLTRWIAPAALAVGLGFGAAALPAPAQAQDELTRVLVDIADVALRGGTPYYRHGNYGYDDRLIASRDRYGRVVYYRTVPRHAQYRSGPPHGNAYGYYRNGPGSRDVKCNKKGKCKAEYYDSRYDRDGRRHQYVRYDRRGDRYWDGRRWRDRDDD
jgi:hypothetical protein